MLVKILTGVFDPPPDHLAVPWAYLLGVGVTTVAAIGVVVWAVVRTAHRPTISVLREA
jgi:putative ABC transport system permease protein